MVKKKSHFCYHTGSAGQYFPASVFFANPNLNAFAVSFVQYEQHERDANPEAGSLLDALQ